MAATKSHKIVKKEHSFYYVFFLYCNFIVRNSICLALRALFCIYTLRFTVSSFVGVRVLPQERHLVWDDVEMQPLSEVAAICSAVDNKVGDDH